MSPSLMEREILRNIIILLFILSGKGIGISLAKRGAFLIQTQDHNLALR